MNVDSACFDFSKAFDSVRRHDYLIQKLLDIGIFFKIDFIIGLFKRLQESLEALW